MKCSIIIPTYNHLEDCLKPCFESILKYTDLDNKEIIIVANGCIDSTLEWLKTLTHENIVIRWFDSPMGFTRASNWGACVANGEYLIFLNNDTILLPQEKDTWINHLLNPFKDKSVGVTGPHILTFLNYNFIVGFCLATPRYLFSLLDGFNEEYSPGTGEDIEYCIELQRSGYKIERVPTKEGSNFPIYHKAEGTVNDKKEEWNKIYNRNMEILNKKYGKNIM